MKKAHSSLYAISQKPYFCQVLYACTSLKYNCSGITTFFTDFHRPLQRFSCIQCLTVDIYRVTIPNFEIYKIMQKKSGTHKKVKLNKAASGLLVALGAARNTSFVDLTDQVKK